MDLFSNNRELREYIALEIRLAMQQGVSINNGIDRAAIADVRAARILAKIDNVPQAALTEVPSEMISRVSGQLIMAGRSVD